jgi:hypothetical protein
MSLSRILTGHSWCVYLHNYSPMFLQQDVIYKNYGKFLHVSMCDEKQELRFDKEKAVCDLDSSDLSVHALCYITVCHIK